MTAYVLMGDNRKWMTTVRKLNDKTVLVALSDGNVIKRHKVKHQCYIPVQKGITFTPMGKRISAWQKFLAWCRA